MATNKERTSSAAMRKLLLQSASKKEQEIQQIGSVAASTIPQPTIEQPIHEEVKESAPVTETVQEPQPEQMEKPESKPSVQSSPKQKKAKSAEKILGISGRAKIKEYRSNPDIQRNPQKAEADCYGHGIRNAQYRQQHS